MPVRVSWQICHRSQVSGLTLCREVLTLEVGSAPNCHSAGGFPEFAMERYPLRGPFGAAEPVLLGAEPDSHHAREQRDHLCRADRAQRLRL